jgi:hypothetical protein
MKVEQVLIELYQDGKGVAEIGRLDAPLADGGCYTWTVPEDLPVQGGYQIKVLARDNAGQTGEVLSRKLSVSPATESGVLAGAWAGGILALLLAVLIFVFESKQSLGDLISILVGSGFLLGIPFVAAGMLLVAYPVTRPIMAVCVLLGAMLGGRVRMHPDQVGFGMWLGVVVALGLSYVCLYSSNEQTGTSGQSSGSGQ